MEVKKIMKKVEKNGEKKVRGKKLEEKKNQKSWKKSGCEKDAASELLFSLGVNDRNGMKWN